MDKQKVKIDWPKVWEELEVWWHKKPKKVTQKWLFNSYKRTRNQIERLVNKQIRQLPK